MEIGHVLTTLNPFYIFPEEIWELVVQQLENTQDIVNLLQASPPLMVLSKGKQFSWRISEILHVLYSTFLTFVDLKTCRLVSKQWIAAVTSCLETNSIPYKSARLTEVSEVQHTVYRLLSLARNFNNFKWWYKYTWRTEIPLRITGNAGQENLSKKPSSLSLEETSDDAMNIWDAPPLLEVIGHRITRISLKFPLVGNLKADDIISDVLKPLYICLSYLPNLKRLTVSFTDLASNLSKSKRQKALNFISGGLFPFELDALFIFLTETNYMSGRAFYDKFMTAFVNHDQVKEVCAVPWYWRQAHATMFPNIVSIHTWEETLWSLQSFLVDLSGSHLRKLEITLFYLNARYVINALRQSETEALKIWLDEDAAPYIHHLWLRVSAIVLPRQCIPFSLKRRNNPSNIRCLRIMNVPQGYDFSIFGLLPLLEYLTIGIDCSSWKCLSRGVGKTAKKCPFGAALQKMIQEDSNSPDNFMYIWDEQQNLKMLTILQKTSNLTSKYQYTRQNRDAVFIGQNLSCCEYCGTDYFY